MTWGPSGIHGLLFNPALIQSMHPSLSLSAGLGLALPDSSSHTLHVLLAAEAAPGLGPSTGCLWIPPFMSPARESDHDHAALGGPQSLRQNSLGEPNITSEP